MSGENESRSVAPNISLPQTPFYAIEYPGIVDPRSIPKAIERLGGTEIVTETFKRSLKIDLRIKENDPFGHCPVGQTVTSTNLLLKVVTRRKRAPSAAEGGKVNTPLGQYTAEILGPIHKTIRFRSPLDFQFRPPKDDPVVQLRDAMARLDAKYILGYRLPEEKEDYTLSPEEQRERGLSSSSNARLMPPPLFTAHDLPMNYNFKQKTGTVEQEIIDKVTGEKTTRLVSAYRTQETFPVTIRWSDPTPTSCGKEREALRESVRPELLKKVQDLLEQRPIWTRLALMNQLSAAEDREMHSQKHIWSICSYGFQDGPWRDSAVRFGYDPRQDPDALKYQIVSLRNLKNQHTRPSMLQPGGPSTESKRDATLHIFDGTSPKHSGTFQFCDITDEMVRAFIDDPIHRQETCDVRDGWLDHVTHERIKHLMKFKHQHLSDTGLPPTEEECASFLIPDEEYQAAGKKSGPKYKKRKKAKMRENLPEEEIAARRLELAVSQMAVNGEDPMDLD